jgi:ParB family chromosome partitioning protein
MFSADNNSGAPTSSDAALPKQPSGPTTRLSSSSVPAVEDADLPASGEAGERPKRLPYDAPSYVVRHLHVKMTPEHFAQGAREWMRVLREEQPEEYRALLLELNQQEQPA